MNYGAYNDSYGVTYPQPNDWSLSSQPTEQASVGHAENSYPISFLNHGSGANLVKHTLIHNHPAATYSWGNSGTQFQSVIDQNTEARDAEARLDRQHFALRLWMDSLYPFKGYVEQLLQAGQQRTPAVLDVGTGSGRWTVDMAIEFPEAHITGIDMTLPDIASQLSKSELPANCRFETDDFNLEMKHYANAFSLVHARRIHSGLKDTEGFIYEMARVLKPGGMLILTSGEPQGFNEYLRPYKWSPLTEFNPDFSWVQYLGGIAYMTLLQKGDNGTCGMVYWKDWLRANPNFCEVLYQEVYIPLGPWPEGLDDRQQFAAKLMREELAHTIVSLKPFYVSGGHSEADAVSWIEAAVEELKQMTRKTYRRVRYFGAIRSNNPFQERTMPIAPDWFGRNSLIYGIDPQLLRPT